MKLINDLVRLTKRAFIRVVPERPPYLMTWSRRMIAFAIDLTFAGTFATLVSNTLLMIGAGASGPVLILRDTLVVVFGIALPFFLANPIFMSRAGRGNGQSLGHALSGLRVINLDDSPITLVQAFKRELLYKLGIAASIFFILAIPATILINGSGFVEIVGAVLGTSAFLSLCILTILPLRDPLSHAWHDKLSGTEVRRVYKLAK